MKKQKTKKPTTEAPTPPKSSTSDAAVLTAPVTVTQDERPKPATHWVNYSTTFFVVVKARSEDEALKMFAAKVAKLKKSWGTVDAEYKRPVSRIETPSQLA